MRVGRVFPLSRMPEWLQFRQDYLDIQEAR